MPFTIKALKVYVYSPNLVCDVKLSEKQKDYEVLTIDEFQNKCRFHYIIDEISYNTYLLKNGTVININQINSGIKLLSLSKSKNIIDVFNLRQWCWKRISSTLCQKDNN